MSIDGNEQLLEETKEDAMTESYKDILYETVAPRVARITLNRPKFMNAYSGVLCHEVVSALDRYAKDDELRCLILTGAGRGFCAGGDISGEDPSHADYMKKQLSHAIEMRDFAHRVVLALTRLDKPVIAMINGAAVAGGLTFALSCDIRIASDQAKLGDTSGKFGLLPDEGGAWLFPRFMGRDKALKMTFLSEVYTAAEAEKLGLVTEVVPHAELEARTMELAQKIAAGAPLAIRLAKAMMNRSEDISLERSLGDAALSVMISNPSEDVKEGVKAFFEKRAPKFMGR